MNTFSPTHTAESKAPLPVRQSTREGCPAVTSDQRRKQEDERVFEARLQWFLAVSAAA